MPAALAGQIPNMRLDDTQPMPDTPATKPDASAADPQLPAPRLWRRLAAMVYDGLLLFAVLMLATVPWLALSGGDIPAGGARHAYRAWLLLIGCGFFALFWRLGGQTLGMRAWRLQARSAQGGLSWRQAWLRSVAALLSWLPAGLGFLWSLADANRQTWHDRLSKTHLVVIPGKRRLR
jgi:uncharacterized RDD family membrane protein YckC